MPRIGEWIRLYIRGGETQYLRVWLIDKDYVICEHYGAFCKLNANEVRRNTNGGWLTDRTA